MITAQLIPHPTSPAGPVRGLDAAVERTSVGLHLTYRLDGSLDRLRIPPPVAPKMDWTLWMHTCFEVFVSAAGDTAYYELNFSPSGEWGAFSFARYREGGICEDATLAPDIAVHRIDDQLELRATVRLAQLSPGLPTAPLRLGLTAVIEADDGSLSYWSLHHLPGKADFHHSDTFVLRLETPQR